MGKVRDELIQQLWHGQDPFTGFDAAAHPPDKQGWQSRHRFLHRSVREVRATVAIEIGVWKGASVITLAHAMKEAGIDGVVIAIDTWLGSAEHWVDPEYFKSLKVSGGYPTMQRTFMSNILDEGLQDYVVPFPIDSVNANVFAKKMGWKAQVIHIDAGHDYEAVKADIKAWWPILQPGGRLIGDDYRDDGLWPGVRQAFDELVAAERLTLEAFRNKCLVKKP